MVLNIPSIFNRKRELLKKVERISEWAVGNLEFAKQVSWADLIGGSGIPTGIFFKPDGKEMYVADTDSQDIYQFTLENPWDLGGKITQTNKEAVTGFPQALFFKPDGLKVFYADTNDPELYEFNLGTAWDLSTMGAETSESIAYSPLDLIFNADGSKLYFLDFEAGGWRIVEAVLNTAWDVGDGFASSSASVVSEDATASFFCMSPNRRKIILYGATNDSVYEYETKGSVNIDNPKLIIDNDFASKRRKIENSGVSGMFINQQGTRAYFTTATSPEVIIQYDFKEKEVDPR